MGDFICYSERDLRAMKPSGSLPGSEISRRLVPQEPFPQDSLGREEWLGIVAWLKQVGESTSPMEIESQLERLRGLWLRELLVSRSPRLFISHRSVDAPLALAIGKVAKQLGFDIWIDVLDPDLQLLIAQPNDVQKAVATAVIVEMAILNCSHLVAAMTPATMGSWWVPYEYGRIKEKRLQTSNVGAWLDSQFYHNLPQGPAGKVIIPEYLYLGERVTTTSELTHWLAQEFHHWHVRFAAPYTPQTWAYGATINLP